MDVVRSGLIFRVGGQWLLSVSTKTVVVVESKFSSFLHVEQTSDCWLIEVSMTSKARLLSYKNLGCQ